MGAIGTSADRNRLEWLDSARGLGIILVVLGHAARGLTGAGIIPKEGWPFFLDRWIYAFHMPLFFVLAGFFAVRWQKRTWSSFLDSRLRTLAYPYILWGLVQTTMQVMLSSFTNGKATVGTLLRILYEPPGQFWFLYVLAIVSLLHIILLKAARSASLALLAAVILSVVGDYWSPGWGPLRQVFQYLPFYAVGPLVAPAATSLTQRSSHFRWLVVVLTLVGLTAVVMTDARLWFPGSLLACVGIVATALLSMDLIGPKSKWLRSLGKNSLQIYVAHTMASAGYRISLKVAGITDPTIHLVGGTLVGLAFPMLLVAILNRAGIGNVFKLDAWKSR